MKSVTFIFLGILVVGMLASLASNKQKFYNSEMRYSSTLGDTVKIVHAFLTAKRVDAVPKTPLLNYDINPTDLRQPKSDFLYRLGHSSVLMHIEVNVLLQYSGLDRSAFIRLQSQQVRCPTSTL